MPPRQPAISPTVVPNTAAPGTTISTTIIETRAPCTMRAQMSRPMLSVPSQYSPVPPSNTGGASRLSTSMSPGSPGEIRSAKAAKTMNRIITSAGGTT